MRFIIKHHLTTASMTLAAVMLFIPLAYAPARIQQPTFEAISAAARDSLLIIGEANNGAATPFNKPDDPIHPEFGNNGQKFRQDRALPAAPEAEWAMMGAMASREPVTDLVLAAEANYFELNRAEYFVPVTLKMPGVHFAATGSATRIFLDIIGEVRQDGVVMQKFRESVDVRLSEETAKELPMRQLAFDSGFTLFPGEYTLKFLVHDRNTGHIGTYQTTLSIPNLWKEDKHLPISSVVLSDELIPLEDALPNSMQPRSFPEDKQFPADPLLVEGKKLVPAIARVFSKSRGLIVFLHAYEHEQNARPAGPVAAFVSLYVGQAKVFETSPLTVTDDLGQTLRTLPVQLHIPLTTVPTGEYNCQVTVLNLATQKSAMWQSRIKIVD